MTPDPLPVALPELEALDKPWRAWSGRINGKFAEVLVYNAEYIQARDAQMQAALRAQAEEVAALRADAERYRWLIETFGDHLHGAPSIEAAFDDDIDDWRSATFFSLRTKEQFDAAIDVHLAASKQEKPHG